MRRTVPALWLLILPSCFYPADRGRALETKVERLQADNEELRASLEDKLSRTLPRIDEKLVEMSQAMELLDKATHRSDADTGIQLQKTIEDLAQLRGQVETYQFKIAELEQALQKTNEESEKRLTELKGPEAVKAAEARRKVEEIKRPDDKREFLRLADDKARGEPMVARELYTEFLKKWSRDELAGEAHFGLGETYFAEDKCREALFEYGKVIQEYAKTRSAPTAYLRSADCFRKLRMNEESKLALEEVMRSFPKSDAARTAKTRLAELEKKKTATPPAPTPKKGKK